MTGYIFDAQGVGHGFVIATFFILSSAADIPFPMTGRLSGVEAALSVCTIWSLSAHSHRERGGGCCIMDPLGCNILQMLRLDHASPKYPSIRAVLCPSLESEGPLPFPGAPQRPSTPFRSFGPLVRQPAAPSAAGGRSSLRPPGSYPTPIDPTAAAPSVP